MNDYELQIKSYRHFIETGRYDNDPEGKKSALAIIKSLEPLAERTEEERIEMFNSGAFNEVLKAYTEVTLKNCKLDDDTIHRVMGELNYTLDMMTAKEVLKKYRGW